MKFSFLSFLFILTQSAFAFRSDINRFHLIRDQYETYKFLDDKTKYYNLNISAYGSLAAKDLKEELETDSTSSLSTSLQEGIDTEHFLKIDLQIRSKVYQVDFKYKKQLAYELVFRKESGETFSMSEDFSTELPFTKRTNEAALQYYKKSSSQIGARFKLSKNDLYFIELHPFLDRASDIYQISYADEIIARGGALHSELPENTTSDIMTHLNFGIESDVFKFVFRVEDQKLLNISSSAESGSPFIYGRHALYGVHFDYKIKYNKNDHIWIFAGLMKRSGYNFNDGVYKGIYLYTPKQINYLLAMDRHFLTLSSEGNVWRFIDLKAYARIPIEERLEEIQLTKDFGVVLSFNFGKKIPKSLQVSQQVLDEAKDVTIQENPSNDSQDEDKDEDEFSSESTSEN